MYQDAQQKTGIGDCFSPLIIEADELLLPNVGLRHSTSDRWCFIHDTTAQNSKNQRGIEREEGGKIIA